MPLFDASDLIVILTHHYALKYVKPPTKTTEGGYGSAIALSQLLACEGYIQWMTNVACLMHAHEGKTIPESTRVKLHDLKQSFQNSYPMATLLTADEMTLLSPLELRNLFNHQTRFDGPPLAQHILSYQMPWGNVPMLRDRLIHHMNEILTKWISTGLTYGGQYLLLNPLSANSIKPPLHLFTHDFMFSPQEIHATFNMKDNSAKSKTALLEALKAHLEQHKQDEALLPAVEARSGLFSLLKDGFFAGEKKVVEAIEEAFQCHCQ